MATTTPTVVPTPTTLSGPNLPQASQSPTIMTPMPISASTSRLLQSLDDMLSDEDGDANGSPPTPYTIAQNAAALQADKTYRFAATGPYIDISGYLTAPAVGEPTFAGMPRGPGSTPTMRSLALQWGANDSTLAINGVAITQAALGLASPASGIVGLLTPNTPVVVLRDAQGTFYVLRVDVLPALAARLSAFVHRLRPYTLDAGAAPLDVNISYWFNPGNAALTRIAGDLDAANRIGALSFTFDAGGARINNAPVSQMATGRMRAVDGTVHEVLVLRVGEQFYVVDPDLSPRLMAKLRAFVATNPAIQAAALGLAPYALNSTAAALDPAGAYFFTPGTPAATLVLTDMDATRRAAGLQFAFTPDSVSINGLAVTQLAQGQYAAADGTLHRAIVMRVGSSFYLVDLAAAPQLGAQLQNILARTQARVRNLQLYALNTGAPALNPLMNHLFVRGTGPAPRWLTQELAPVTAQANGLQFDFANMKINGSAILKYAAGHATDAHGRLREVLLIFTADGNFTLLDVQAAPWLANMLRSQLEHQRATQLGLMIIQPGVGESLDPLQGYFFVNPPPSVRRIEQDGQTLATLSAGRAITLVVAGQLRAADGSYPATLLVRFADGSEMLVDAVRAPQLAAALSVRLAELQRAQAATQAPGSTPYMLHGTTVLDPTVSHLFALGPAVPTLVTQDIDATHRTNGGTLQFVFDASGASLRLVDSGRTVTVSQIGYGQMKNAEAVLKDVLVLRDSSGKSYVIFTAGTPVLAQKLLPYLAAQQAAKLALPLYLLNTGAPALDPRKTYLFGPGNAGLVLVTQTASTSTPPITIGADNSVRVGGQLITQIASGQALHSANRRSAVIVLRDAAGTFYIVEQSPVTPLVQQLQRVLIAMRTPVTPPATQPVTPPATLNGAQLHHWNLASFGTYRTVGGDLVGTAIEGSMSFRIVAPASGTAQGGTTTVRFDATGLSLSVPGTGGPRLVRELALGYLPGGDTASNLRFVVRDANGAVWLFDPNTSPNFAYHAATLLLRQSAQMSTATRAVVQSLALPSYTLGSGTVLDANKTYRLLTSSTLTYTPIDADINADGELAGNPDIVFEFGPDDTSVFVNGTPVKQIAAGTLNGAARVVLVDADGNTYVVASNAAPTLNRHLQAYLAYVKNGHLLPYQLVAGAPLLRPGQFYLWTAGSGASYWRMSGDVAAGTGAGVVTGVAVGTSSAGSGGSINVAFSADGTSFTLSGGPFASAGAAGVTFGKDEVALGYLARSDGTAPTAQDLRIVVRDGQGRLYVFDPNVSRNFAARIGVMLRDTTVTPEIAPQIQLATTPYTFGLDDAPDMPPRPRPDPNAPITLPEAPDPNADTEWFNLPGVELPDLFTKYQFNPGMAPYIRVFREPDAAGQVDAMRMQRQTNGSMQSTTTPLKFEFDQPAGPIVINGRKVVAIAEGDFPFGTALRADGTPSGIRVGAIVLFDAEGNRYVITGDTPALLKTMQRYLEAERNGGLAPFRLLPGQPALSADGAYRWHTAGATFDVASGDIDANGIGRMMVTTVNADPAAAATPPGVLDIRFSADGTSLSIDGQVVTQIAFGYLSGVDPTMQDDADMRIVVRLGDRYILFDPNTAQNFIAYAGELLFGGVAPVPQSEQLTDVGLAKFGVPATATQYKLEPNAPPLRKDVEYHFVAANSASWKLFDDNVIPVLGEHGPYADRLRDLMARHGIVELGFGVMDVDNSGFSRAVIVLRLRTGEFRVVDLKTMPQWFAVLRTAFFPDLLVNGVPGSPFDQPIDAPIVLPQEEERDYGMFGMVTPLATIAYADKILATNQLDAAGKPPQKSIMEVAFGDLIADYYNQLLTGGTLSENRGTFLYSLLAEQHLTQGIDIPNIKEGSGLSQLVEFKPDVAALVFDSAKVQAALQKSLADPQIVGDLIERIKMRLAKIDHSSTFDKLSGGKLFDYLSGGIWTGLTGSGLLTTVRPLGLGHYDPMILGPAIDLLQHMRHSAALASGNRPLDLDALDRWLQMNATTLKEPGQRGEAIQQALEFLGASDEQMVTYTKQIAQYIQYGNDSTAARLRSGAPQIAQIAWTALRQAMQIRAALDPKLSDYIYTSIGVIGKVTSALGTWYATSNRAQRESFWAQMVGAKAADVVQSSSSGGGSSGVAQTTWTWGHGIAVSGEDVQLGLSLIAGTKLTDPAVQVRAQALYDRLIDPNFIDYLAWLRKTGQEDHGNALVDRWGQELAMLDPELGKKAFSEVSIRLTAAIYQHTSLADIPDEDLAAGINLQMAYYLSMSIRAALGRTGAARQTIDVRKQIAAELKWMFLPGREHKFDKMAPDMGMNLVRLIKTADLRGISIGDLPKILKLVNENYTGLQKTQIQNFLRHVDKRGLWGAIGMGGAGLAGMFAVMGGVGDLGNDPYALVTTIATFNFMFNYLLHVPRYASLRYGTLPGIAIADGWGMDMTLAEQWAIVAKRWDDILIKNAARQIGRLAKKDELNVDNIKDALKNLGFRGAQETFDQLARAVVERAQFAGHFKAVGLAAGGATAIDNWARTLSQRLQGVDLSNFDAVYRALVNGAIDENLAAPLARWIATEGELRIGAGKFMTATEFTLDNLVIASDQERTAWLKAVLNMSLKPEDYTKLLSAFLRPASGLDRLNWDLVQALNGIDITNPAAVDGALRNVESLQHVSDQQRRYMATKIADALVRRDYTLGPWHATTPDWISSGRQPIVYTNDISQLRRLDSNVEYRDLQDLAAILKWLTTYHGADQPYRVLKSTLNIVNFSNPIPILPKSPDINGPDAKINIAIRNAASQEILMLLSSGPYGAGLSINRSRYAIGAIVRSVGAISTFADGPLIVAMSVFALQSGLKFNDPFEIAGGALGLGQAGIVLVAAMMELLAFRVFMPLYVIQMIVGITALIMLMFKSKKTEYKEQLRNIEAWLEPYKRYNLLRPDGAEYLRQALEFVITGRKGPLLQLNDPGRVEITDVSLGAYA